MTFGCLDNYFQMSKYNYYKSLMLKMPNLLQIWKIRYILFKMSHTHLKSFKSHFKNKATKYLRSSNKYL